MRFIKLNRILILSAVYYLLFLIFLPVGTARCEEWIEFSSNEYYDSYYDKSRLYQTSAGVWRVLKKDVIRSEKGRDFFIKKRREKGLPLKGYENLEYALTLCEINCQKMQFRLLSLAEYSSSGVELMKTSSDMVSKWIHIPSGSVVYLLQNAVCK